MRWVAVVIALAVTLMVFYRLNLVMALGDEVPTRVRLRALRKMLFWAGLWEWSIAFCLVVMGDPTESAALWAMGLCLMVGPRLVFRMARKVRVQ